MRGLWRIMRVNLDIGFYRHRHFAGIVFVCAASNSRARRTVKRPMGLFAILGNGELIVPNLRGQEFQHLLLRAGSGTDLRVG